MTGSTEVTKHPYRVPSLPSAFLAWVFIAAAYARVRERLDGAANHNEMLPAASRLIATLLCIAVAYPWMLRPRAQHPGTGARHRARSDWGPIIATSVAMSAVYAVLLIGDAGAAARALREAPRSILPATVLLALGEEVYFREALPMGLARGLARGWRRAGAAVGSQFLYAAAHLPTLMFGPAPLRSGALVSTMARDTAFGLLLLMLASGGRHRVERVLIHSAVNLSLVFIPASIGSMRWRGPLMCLLGGLAVRLTRWRATPPSDYTPAWQLANEARPARAPDRPPSKRPARAHARRQ
jgi:membrane protease YdiL (CAAX protease family)